MSYSEIFELRRQIHELHTNATIMETALRMYEDAIEDRDAQIEELNRELSEWRCTEHDFSPYRIIVSRYNKDRLVNITYGKAYNDTITELLDHAEKSHNSRLKLYIWSDFCKGYTDGIAFAIAETENEARHMVMDETGDNGYRDLSWGEVEVRNISKHARYVYGGD